MFSDRKYVVVFVSEIDQINFDEIVLTSPDTIRKSVDGALTFVKYDGEMPPSIAALTNKSEEFTQEQFLVILSGSDWSSI